MNESQIYQGPQDPQSQSSRFFMTSQEVHAFRKKIDALIRELDCFAKTRENSLAYIKLQEANYWLSQVLANMNIHRADIPGENCVAISQQA